MCLTCTQVVCTLHIKMDCDAFIKSIIARVTADYKVVKKTKRSKKVAKVVPVHNHSLSTEIHPGCPLCQSHGNVLNMSDAIYEIVFSE
jgi:hypothetical protein